MALSSDWVSDCLRFELLFLFIFKGGFFIIEINGKMISKKVLIDLILVATLIMTTTFFVYAASSSVDASWYTGNAGSCNGKTNKVFHSLSAGNAYLSGGLEESNGSTKTYPVYATLYKSDWGPDTEYNTVKFTSSSDSTHKIGSSVTKSSDYYLIIGGGTHDKNHNFVGTLSN